MRICHHAVISLGILLFLLTACSSTQRVLKQGPWDLTDSDCNPQGDCIGTVTDRSRLLLHYEHLRSDKYSLFFDSNGELKIIMVKPDYMEHGKYRKYPGEGSVEARYRYSIQDKMILLINSDSGKIESRWRIVKLKYNSDEDDELLLEENGIVKRYTRSADYRQNDSGNSFKLSNCCMYPALVIFFLFADFDSLTP